MRRSEHRYLYILGQMFNKLGHTAPPIMESAIHKIESQMNRASYTAFDFDRADAVYSSLMYLRDGLVDLDAKFARPIYQPDRNWLLNSYGEGIDAGVNENLDSVCFFSKKIDDETARLELRAIDHFGHILIDTYVHTARLGLVNMPDNATLVSGSIYMFDPKTWSNRSFRKVGIEFLL